MHESPEKFKWFKDHPPATTDALLFGQYYHALVLEPDKAETDFMIMPDFNLRTNAGMADKAALQADCAERGIILIERESANTARLMADKCRSDPEVMKLLNGAHEQPFFWTDELTGEECKCRLDVLTEVDGECAIVDLKSTANAATHKLVRDIYKLGYFMQGAMYGEGVRINLGLDRLPRFILIAQEKKPPFAINRIELPEDVIQLGYDRFREYLGIYHECKETGLWYGLNGVTNELNEAYLLEYVKNGDEDDA